MSPILSFRNLAFPLLSIAVVFGVAAMALLSSAVLTYPIFAKAALADLLITGPVLFLFFAYKRGLSLIIIVPIANIGLEIALLTAPTELHHLIYQAMWVTYPLLACVIIRTMVLGGQKLSRTYPAVAGIPDIRDRLDAWLAQCVGPTISAKMMASDLAFLRFAIWPPRAIAHGPGRFSGHRQSGLVPLLWALVMLLVIETVVLHILIHLAAPALAWLVTALSLYSMMTVIGHIRALPRRHCTLNDKGVMLRAGLFAQCHIPYDQIDRIVPLAPGQPVPDDTWQLGMLGSMEPRNLLVRLHQPATVCVTHGLTRDTRNITLHLDDPQYFTQAVLQMCNRPS